MATYAIYNYEFEPIQRQHAEGELGGMETVLMRAAESFPKKQEIFGSLLEKDYKKTSREDIIHFRNRQGPKEYIHRHLIPPTDDITVIRVANKRTHKIVDKKWEDKKVDDYQNCIVIIDNRPGIQRILIENKKAAFADTKTTANILENTFNFLLARYSLSVTLRHLQDKRSFWAYAKDRSMYPTGFHKLMFFLPFPNLDRLRKGYERLFSQARRCFNSRMNMEFINPRGEVRLDENDPYQSELIEWFMEEAGGSIRLYPNNAKRSPIVVGLDSFRTATVSDKTILRLTEDAVNNDLFGSAALEKVKKETKKGIEE